MSADGITSARKPDVPATAAAQGKDAVPAASQDRGSGTAAGQDKDAATAGANGQGGTPDSQPAPRLNRYHHAQAVLNSTPGHTRETPTTSTAPDQQQPGKATPTPEHSRPGKDATTASAQGQRGTPDHQPATKLNRHDHAQAILNPKPSHTRETPTTSTAPDQQQPGKGGQQPPEHGRARQGTGPGGEVEGQRGAPGGRPEADGHPVSGTGRQAGRPESPVRQLVAGEVPMSTDRTVPGHEGADVGRDAGGGRDRLQASQVPDAKRSDAPGSQEAWPTRQDRDTGRELYQEYLKDLLSRREQGVNVVGEKPGQSPGDTSDLTPSGEELLKMEDDDASRLEKARHWLNEEIEDIHDATEETVTDIHDLFLRPPPGHPEVAVPAGPAISAPAVEHGTLDPTGIAEVILTGAVVGTAAGRWLWTKVLKREGDHHAGNR